MTHTIPIVDAHCHIASMELLPPSFVDGIITNQMVALEAQGLRPKRGVVGDLLIGGLQDPHCDELKREMDAAGIAHAVLLAVDFTYALRDGRLTIAEILDQ